MLSFSSFLSSSHFGAIIINSTLHLPPKYPQDTQEAKCLADQVEMYYCDATPEKLALLESFTENPSEFRHMDLVAQLESISLVQAAQENVEETNKQK